jgi:hypothetical protein
LPESSRSHWTHYRRHHPASGIDLQAIASVQFFRDGTATVETVVAISPQLVALWGGLKSTESIISAHCAHLKDRAKKNAVNEAVPQIQDALQRLRLGEASICNVDMVTLFWKHLAGALNITSLSTQTAGLENGQRLHSFIFLNSSSLEKPRPGHILLGSIKQLQVV